MENKIVKQRLVLLDAHAILHRAYHALPDFATSKGEPTGALYGLSAMLIKIIEDLRPDYLVSCYDLAGPTYRHEAYKDYKLGRKKAEDDLIAQMKSSRTIFEAMDIPIYDKQGYEADDIIGTIVEIMKPQTGTDEIEIIIASGDMDTMQMISGKEVQVYTLKKGIKDTILYDEEAVHKRFGFGPELIPDYKGLRGDPSDNIIGIKGIGDVTATALIKEFGTIENLYKELEKGDDRFVKAGIKPRIIELLRNGKEEAEFSKMLATIKRDCPINFVLPEKTFMQSLDINKAKSLWNDLEFRTLGLRLEQVTQKKIERPTPPADRVEKVALALWLVNSNSTNPTLEDIYNFANTDDFEKAEKIIMDELHSRNQDKIYQELELPLIPIIKRMEEKGIKVDDKLLKDLSKKYHAEADRLSKEIWREAGVEFNISSPKQLGEVLFDKLGLKAKNMKKTQGGARSTRESELEKLRDLHPVVPMIFEYRELTKLLSTYIDAIPPLLDKQNRLHSHLISAGTTTGRMASENPNLQNIPVKTELGKAIRHAFLAEKGFLLAGFDYSQMELRIAAFMSEDEKLIDIFRKGEDVHSSVASYVFHVPQNEVTSEMRRRAKVINFGIIYGMGVMALKQNLGTSRDEAQEFMNSYFEQFSELAKYMDKVKTETEKRGYTETLFGRRRYFEGINSKIPYVKAQAERMAINAPIQGTGADIIKSAMIKVDEYIRKNSLDNDVYPLLQVHDELIFEVRSEKVDEVCPKIKTIMENILDEKTTKGVITSVKYATGANWGELK